MLRGALGPVRVVLPLVAGEERQIDLLIQIAHVGLRDANLGGQFGVNLAIRGVVLLAPPANAHQHILAVRGAGKGDALSLC